jgi:hypothetical protein
MSVWPMPIEEPMTPEEIAFAEKLFARDAANEERARKRKEASERYHNAPHRVALRALIHKLDNAFDLWLYQDFQG